jgi:hypothetical protein
MTEWEIKWCHCFERCRVLLMQSNLRQDTKDYVESVYLAINAYPMKYPSDKQAYWIHRLYQQHCGGTESTSSGGKGRVPSVKMTD